MKGGSSFALSSGQQTGHQTSPNFHSYLEANIYTGTSFLVVLVSFGSWANEKRKKMAMDEVSYCNSATFIRDASGSNGVDWIATKLHLDSEMTFGFLWVKEWALSSASLGVLLLRLLELLVTAQWCLEGRTGKLSSVSHPTSAWVEWLKNISWILLLFSEWNGEGGDGGLIAPARQSQ